MNKTLTLTIIAAFCAGAAAQAQSPVTLKGEGEGARQLALDIEYRENLPENVIMVNPVGLGKKAKSSAFPEALPPYYPEGHNLVMVLDERMPEGERQAALLYYKTWKGWDGNAMLISSCDSIAIAIRSLQTAEKKANPAVVPTEGPKKKRHAAKAELLQKNKYDVVFLGNSIMNNMERPDYQPIWEKYFGDRNAVNLATSGYRTENLLWDLDDFDLTTQSPKLCIIGIGTNNVNETHYRYRCTAREVAEGTKALLDRVRTAWPETKVILLRCFPGNYKEQAPASHRLILNKVSDIVRTYADGKNVYFCDVNHVFLNIDGSLREDMFYDWLHPSYEGSEAWFRAMEPLVSSVLGDRDHRDSLPENTAIEPVSKLENDRYDWFQRHDRIMAIKDSLKPQIVLIGDSITHFWGGKPDDIAKDGRIIPPAGPESWAYAFGDSRVLNIGFGWDRTQNVLWRLDHGELDGLHPSTVILNIGTNNTSNTKNARNNTPEEIAEGVREVYLRIRSKLPDTRIILMAVFPRNESPDSERRKAVIKIDEQLEKFAKENDLYFVKVWDEFLGENGILPKELFYDFTHPTDKGYMFWAKAIKPLIVL